MNAGGAGGGSTGEKVSPRTRAKTVMCAGARRRVLGTVLAGRAAPGPEPWVRTALSRWNRIVLARRPGQVQQLPKQGRRFLILPREKQRVVQGGDRRDELPVQLHRLTQRRQRARQVAGGVGRQPAAVLAGGGEGGGPQAGGGPGDSRAPGGCGPGQRRAAPAPRRPGGRARRGRARARPDGAASWPYFPVDSRVGVTTKITSASVRSVFVLRKSTPMIGMSPSSGTLMGVSRASALIIPPMMIDSPFFTVTVVLALRVKNGESII